MNTITQEAVGDLQKHAGATTPVQPRKYSGNLSEPVFEELSETLFASLRRSDQRRRGLDYLRGLLRTPGRKSIRNMAALLGGSGTGQSLHHFICNSTWEWSPVRAALAGYLARVAPPLAWVVRPMVIPKTGQHSVGVGRYFSPVDGQVLNAQQAVGLWAVSDRTGVPLNWHLRLPEQWHDVSDCGVPSPRPAPPRPLGDCAVEMCREALADWGLPPRPVVVDIGEANPLPTLRRLTAEGLSSMVRVPGDLPLTVVDEALTGHRGNILPAAQIMRAARELRRPVTWRERGPRPVRRTALVAAVRVRSHPDCGRDTVLVGIGGIGAEWLTELWATSLPASWAATAVPWMSGFVRAVDRDFETISEHVGIRDYVGRSFSGWHRHVTLASAAHAVVALSSTPADLVGHAS
ncbi:IS701 family transposase [Thermobifida alba]|uniref:IS701 family transposase n=1 Tax=Thermobifida alba TaxID=53522 RepID=UPI0020BDD0EB|nr:transposase [Thermobifida alba]